MATAQKAPPRHHQIASQPDNLHWGFFDANLKPVIEINAGDRVSVQCLCGEPSVLPTDPRFKILPEMKTAFETVPRPMPGHLVTGPIHVKGAMPGDVLEVKILDIRLRQNWGYNRIRPLGGTLPEDFPTYSMLHIHLDDQAMLGRMPWGTEIPLNPFFGVIGVAPPPAWGRITTIAPREHGGNLDCKELVAGTTLYLPVFNEGALLSVGDGHAAQGDGEVCSTAIETALSGTFEINVRRDFTLDMPRAESAEAHITFGIDEDLDDAAKQALRQMIRLVSEKTGLSREHAYQLCSITADLRITQLVNGRKGVHAVLNKRFLERG